MRTDQVSSEYVTFLFAGSQSRSLAAAGGSSFTMTNENMPELIIDNTKVSSGSPDKLEV